MGIYKKVGVFLRVLILCAYRDNKKKNTLMIVEPIAPSLCSESIDKHNAPYNYLPNG